MENVNFTTQPLHTRILIFFYFLKFYSSALSLYTHAWGKVNLSVFCGHSSFHLTEGHTKIQGSYVVQTTGEGPAHLWSSLVTSEKPLGQPLCLGCLFGEPFSLEIVVSGHL